MNKNFYLLYISTLLSTDGINEVTYDELKQSTLADDYTISCK